jgi:two-component system KDP operon response regulator KdpE
MVLIGHYSLDLAARTVTRRADAPGTASAHVRLTRTEWAILEVLAGRPCILVPGPELMDLVWGPSETPKTHHLRFHISKLRHKLEPEPSRPRQLITEPGVGYLFKSQSPPGQANGFESA